MIKNVSTLSFFCHNLSISGLFPESAAYAGEYLFRCESEFFVKYFVGGRCSEAFKSEYFAMESVDHAQGYRQSCRQSELWDSRRQYRQLIGFVLNVEQTGRWC